MDCDKGRKPLTTVNTLLCQVKGFPLHLINTPLVSLEVTSSVSAQVPDLISTHVPPVKFPSLSAPVAIPIASLVSPVMSPLCPISPGTFILPLKTTQTMSHEQPVDTPVRSECLKSAFIKET